jgi:glyoxylase-like metal-dependent hydrolase (beta-lactamase superfamily II)
MAWRRAGLVTFAWLAASVSSASGGLEVSVEKARSLLIKEDLGRGVYVFRAPRELESWTATNSVVIVGDDEVTVFDSCTRAVTAQAVIAEIRSLTPKPVRFLINSHWHQDHWSGNVEYVKAFPGLRIIATYQTRAYMSRMGPRFFVDELEQFGLQQMREDLAKAVKTGKRADGSLLTADVRTRMEAGVARGNQFALEIENLPRILPNLAYREEMTFWSGSRELRLLSLTGDATAATALYLPDDKVLVTGDVLVSPEDGTGPPPWTTSSYAVTPWLESLRRLEALDADIIVPGQGPAMHDKEYLRRTIRLFATVIDQVHVALERGVVKLAQVQAAVDVKAIGQEYAPGHPLDPDFSLVAAFLVQKVMQESLDGGADIK